MSVSSNGGGFDFRLGHPFSMLIVSVYKISNIIIIIDCCKNINFVYKQQVGCSRSGKSSLCMDIIRNKEQLISKPISKIVYVYSFTDQHILELEKRSDVVLLTNLQEVDHNLSPDSLIIIDDRSIEASSKNSTQITNYFLRLCSHANISLILILHRLYLGDKIRTISLNCSYLIYFRNPRSSSEVQHLARDIFGKNSTWLVSAYNIATREPFSYLMIGKTFL